MKKTSVAYCSKQEVPDKEQVANKVNSEKPYHQPSLHFPYCELYNCITNAKTSIDNDYNYKHTQTEDFQAMNWENSTQVEQCTCHTCHALANAVNFKEMQEFREANFFETHSATNFTGCDNHQCIYCFTLDEKKEPFLVNGDENGRFRCVICCKALEVNVKQETERKVCVCVCIVFYSIFLHVYTIILTFSLIPLLNHV